MAILEEEVEKQEEEQQSKTKNRHVSVPIEIVEEVLLRLPVESILRSTAVSKPWLSLISHPSFSRLQFTHATSAHRTAFFIAAFDTSTHKRHYLSAASHGGPLHLLMSVDGYVECSQTFSAPSHFNGLVCFTSKTMVPGYGYPITSQAFVANPSTRRFFKLLENIGNCGYLYGFDESTNQHKILLKETLTREFMVFDILTCSLRKIDAEPPVGFNWYSFHEYLDGGVCLDSKVHILLDAAGTQLFNILAFDFVTEKFSLMSIPQDVCPHFWNPGEDYQHGVWVKETVTLPEPWNALARDFPLSMDGNMDDEIVFSISKVSENVMIVPVYNRKSKSFRSLEFTLDSQVLSTKTLMFHHIKHYVDSMVPV